MTDSSDILHRIAARLGLRPEELSPYMDATLALAAEALRAGECVELMTFGTLCPTPEGEVFHAHPSLLSSPPTGEGT